MIISGEFDTLSTDGNGNTIISKKLIINDGEPIENQSQIIFDDGTI